MLPLRVFAFLRDAIGARALDQVARAHGMLDAADGWGESFDRRKRVGHSPRLFGATCAAHAFVDRLWTLTPIVIDPSDGCGR
jgi:hypothetical protein